MIALRFESRLAVPAAEVWAQASTMAGVNAELMPLLRMTVPADFAAQSLEQAPERLGQTLFHSWLLLFGFLPFDRHALRLMQVYPGCGFDEDSTSWLQKTWRHRRRIVADGDGCRVIDELEVEPRLAPAVFVRPLLRQVFAHRHRQLRRRFGSDAS